MAGLLAASSMPNLVFAPDPVLDTVIRKVGHFVAFALVGILIYAACPAWISRRRAAQLALLAAVVIAVGDELRQASVPGRIASPLDAAIDVAGAVAGTLLYRRARPDGGERR